MASCLNRTKLLSGASLIALAVTASAPVSAQSSWHGNFSNDWYSDRNWSSGLPNSGTDVTIAMAGAPNWPIISRSVAQARDIFLGYSGNWGYLTISNGGVLETVNGYVDSGTAFRKVESSVSVVDPGSSWNLSGQLVIGKGALGALSISRSALVEVKGGSSIGGSAGSEGKVIVVDKASFKNDADLHIGRGARVR